MTNIVNCIACLGTKRGYVYRDRDPIEGYKMAPQHTCIMCAGDGVLDTDMRSDGKAILAYIEAQKNENKRQQLVSSALSKLTAEEKEALGL